jgi:hypothetical protein
MDARSRQRVRHRARDCCEYCQLPQSAAPFLTFHVEHIVAAQHGRDDSLGNLALACPDCNRHKGPNLSSIDPQTGDLVPLFHPRLQKWSDHFRIEQATIVGRTETGRATARLLRFNDPERQSMRTVLLAIGEWGRNR